MSPEMQDAIDKLQSCVEEIDGEWGKVDLAKASTLFQQSQLQGWLSVISKQGLYRKDGWIKMGAPSLP